MPFNPEFSSLAQPTQEISTQGWYITDVVYGIKEDEVPWMLAQGYEVINAYTDIAHGRVFKMERREMQNDVVVDTLLESFSEAYNQGRESNETRYQDIVKGMTELIDCHRTETEAISDDTEFKGTITSVITELDELLDGQPTFAEWNESVEKLKSAIDEYDIESAAALARYVDTLGQFSTGLPTIAEFTSIVDKLDGKTDDFDTDSLLTGQFAAYLTDIAGLTGDAPELSDFISGIEILDSKLDEYDTQIASLRSKYQLDTSKIETKIDEGLAKVASALATYRSQVQNLDAEQAETEASIKATLAGEATTMDSHIVAVNGHLDDLAQNYIAHLNAVDTAIDISEAAVSEYALEARSIADAMEAAQSTHEASIAGLLAEMTSSFAGRTTTLTGILSTLVTDYSSHAATATGFLDGLGVEELDRINEKFDNLNAANRQSLTQRGLYSSAIVLQMETQVERDRDAAIQELNDRLNREKFENQHRLFEQQAGMRDKHLTVYTGIQTLEQQILQAKSEVEGTLNARSMQSRELSATTRRSIADLRGDVASLESQMRESFARISQDAKNQVLSGIEQLQAIRLQKTQADTSAHGQIFDNIAGVFERRLSGEDQFARLDASLRESQQSTLSRLEDLGQAWSRVEAGMLEAGIQARSSSANVAADVRGRYHDIVLRQKVAAVEGRLAAITTKASTLEAGLRARGVAANVASDVRRTYYDLILRHKLAESEANRANVTVTIDSLRSGMAARTDVTRTDADLRTAYYDLLLRQKVGIGSEKLKAALAKSDLLTRHIDERNRVAMALFGFVERREDSYPGVGSMAQVAASLGESGTSAWRSA